MSAPRPSSSLQVRPRFFQHVAGLLTVDPKKRLPLSELTSHPWLYSSSHIETPLQTPSVLPSTAGQTFNETLYAFLAANRDGFQLMDVTAAPLLKVFSSSSSLNFQRRGVKRQSGERADGQGGAKRLPFDTFETVPEAEESAVRPTHLPITPDLLNYREPQPSTIRHTRDSNSS